MDFYGNVGNLTSTTYKEESIPIDSNTFYTKYNLLGDITTKICGNQER